MSQNHSAVVNLDQFVTQFMGSNPDLFLHKKSLIQLHPLSMAFSFLKAPTPLFRPEYNFLLLFLNGGGKQQVDNEIIELKANDALFIREGHLNAINSIESSTDGYFIYIDNTLLPQLFTKTLLNRFTFNPKHSVSQEAMNWLCKCCDLMLQQENNSNHSDEIKTSLLKALLLTLAETWPASSSRPDRKSEVTMLFKELLYDNFTHTRDVKFYADSLAMSENYLNRCVNHVTNKPPKQHINELVIYHSKILLQDFSKDVAQVAFDLNFSDPSYFGRLFKQITNVTPSEYRSLIMQGLSE